MQVGVLMEQCLSPVPGGTGRYSAELAAALARRRGPADSVSGWVSWHREAARAQVPGVDGPHRLGLPRRALIAAWAHGHGPRLPVDLVHAPTPLAPPRGRRPLVVTVHDAVPWTHPETLTARGATWHRAAIGQACRTADLLVVPTQAVADELSRHVSLPAVRVVGEGVAASLVVPTAGADERARELDLPAHYLLTVSTLEPRKGLTELVQALATPGGPDLPLLCAGQPGWGGELPEQVAASVGLAPGRVRTLGRLPDADLALLYSRATAVVVPSRSEGFGLPLLEAMSFGTPVLTSDAAALVEVAGGAALAVPLEELAGGLARIVADETLRARLRRDGPVRAGQFSWDGAADRLWSAYRELAEGG